MGASVEGLCLHIRINSSKKGIAKARNLSLVERQSATQIILGGLKESDVHVAPS